VAIALKRGVIEIQSSAGERTPECNSAGDGQLNFCPGTCTTRICCCVMVTAEKGSGRGYRADGQISYRIAFRRGASLCRTPNHALMRDLWE
jgi:hypothetical protein